MLVEGLEVPAWGPAIRQNNLLTSRWKLLDLVADAQGEWSTVVSLEEHIDNSYHVHKTPMHEGQVTFYTLCSAHKTSNTLRG